MHGDGLNILQTWEMVASDSQSQQWYYWKHNEYDWLTAESELTSQLCLQSCSQTTQSDSFPGSALAHLMNSGSAVSTCWSRKADWYSGCGVIQSGVAELFNLDKEMLSPSWSSWITAVMCQLSKHVALLWCQGIPILAVKELWHVRISTVPMKPA